MRGFACKPNLAAICLAVAVVAAGTTLFATEAGTIRGWNPALPPTPPATSTQTFVGPNDADQSGAGAIFKGLAIAGSQLYATDFHNAKVDVFDSSFHLVPGGFVDPKLPK